MLPVHFDDVADLDQSPVLSAAEVGEAFPTTFFMLQPWDELLERTSPGQAPDAYEYATRLDQLLGEAAAFGDKARIIGLDVLTRRGDSLWCLPEVFDARTCTFSKVAYLNTVDQMAQAAAVAHTPDLMLVGASMNRLIDLDPEGWSGFVSWFTGPIATNIKTPLTTVIDWETFVAHTDARAASLLDAGEDEETAPALAAQQVWDEQFVQTGIVDHLDVIALQSRPTALRVEDLPDDYYARLIPLIPENMPVAFLPLVWSTNTGGVGTKATQFLQRFRWLAAGLNVVHLSWGRLFDVETGKCSIMKNIGIDKNACNDGLVPTTGRPKSVWDEILDESPPAPLPSE